ncbi:MAG: hypothetical protein ACREDF_01390 [Thermoplasmata archaeon]
MNATEPGSFEAPAGQAPRPVAGPPYAAFPPQPIGQVRDPRAKSPRLAAVFSLMPGLGQVYVGYYPRGFVHIVVVAGIISILASSDGEPPYLPLLALFMAFFWLYNVIDAARLASLYNRALAGGKEPDLPEGFKLPGMGGSILGGSVLVAAGFIVLLHTRWGVRLDWVGEWWPVFPMLLGIYLVAKAVADRKARSGV